MSDPKESELVQTETPRPQPDVVTAGSVLSMAMTEMAALVAELRARREFDEDVSEWLNQDQAMRVMRTMFERFRAARRAAKPPA